MIYLDSSRARPCLFWISQEPNQITLIFHCFKENKNKHIMLRKRFNHTCHITHELDIALGNRALRAQPTDYSLIC